MTIAILSRVPIRVSVPILLALPVLLAALLLSLLSYHEQKSSARELALQQLMQTHQQIESHIDGLLNAPRRINLVNAALIDEGRLPLNDIGSWRDTLIAQLQAYDMLSSIVWGGQDGQCTWICRYVGDTKHTYYAIKDAAADDKITEYRVRSDGQLDPEPSGAFVFDPRERPWYRTAFKAGEASWCAPFLWVGGGDAAEETLGISYGQPIYDDNGKIAGIIDADLSLNDISHYLSRLRIGKTGVACVIDREGLIIGSSTGADLATPDGCRVAAVASSQPWIAAATLILGVILSLFMVRPVLELTHHARRMGEGELERKIHLTQSPELIRLSDEMNEMAVGLRDRLRMRHSLAVAMEVQQALLPSNPPRVEGLDVAGHSTYCDETGGDYYDFLDISGIEEHAVAIALGDVMGHGVAAAMLMATARGILRSRSQEPRSLSDLLTHMNHMLVPDTGGKRFMTMLLMVLDTQKKVLRWAAAGHEPPFVYDPSDDSYHELDGAGLPLGIIEQEPYEQYEYANIRSGQVLFVGTDGVWETVSAAGEPFGKKRIRELLQRHYSEPAEKIAEHIRNALAVFREEGSQDDDITFVIIRVL